MKEDSMTESSCETIKALPLPVGLLQSNCYLVYCSNSRKAVIIDPGEEGDRILEAIRERRLQPVWILLTHGHGDHIGAIGFLKQHFSIPVAIHREEASMLTDPTVNMSSLFGLSITAPPADRLLKDGDVIDFEGKTISVLHTPGHSPGGVSYRIDQYVFTGDALFKGTVGRTDIPGGSHVRLIHGIKEKILALDDEVIVYPGHGPVTTVGEERRFNPYLQ